jgi:hypothetical protein
MVAAENDTRPGDCRSATRNAAEFLKLTDAGTHRRPERGAQSFLRPGTLILLPEHYEYPPYLVGIYLPLEPLLIVCCFPELGERGAMWTGTGRA